jgi:hypothetical protein
LLKEILPFKMTSILHRWSGIMGMGNSNPIVSQLSENVCGVRLGGMGLQ